MFQTSYSLHAFLLIMFIMFIIMLICDHTFITCMTIDHVNGVSPKQSLLFKFYRDSSSSSGVKLSQQHRHR